MAEEPFLIRDLFNKKLVLKLAANIHRIYPEFNETAFVSEAMSTLPTLSFGDRSSLIADTLHKYLPKEFEKSAHILINSLGPEPDAEELTGADGFYIMPLCLFVRRYGKNNVDMSLEALYEMTKRFTAEGDIRYFITHHREKTMKFLDKLTTDKSPFARRLASEGTRPRLPLGSRLYEFIKDPTSVIALLEKLKDDPNLMVRRSVANNLNDIAKDNSDIVVQTLKRWNAEPTPERTWLVKHALRTLLKQGHPGALKLLGYDPTVNVSVSPITLTSSINIGDLLVFNFKLTNNEKQETSLMIDYIIYYMKANGAQKPKVFKLAKKTLKPGETMNFRKSHRFTDFSTRKHYPGTHAIAIQVNGIEYKKHAFSVESSQKRR